MLYSTKHEDQLTPLLNTDYHRTKPLEVEVIDEGIFLPLKKISEDGPLMGNGGVLDADGNYVLHSAQVGKGDTRDRFNGAYEFSETELVYEDTTVIYMGAFPEHWGHFLVDFIGRAWYLLDAGHTEKIVYTSEKNQIGGVYKEFFELLGVDTDRLERITTPTRYAKIIVPEMSYMPCAYFTDEFKAIFARVAESVRNKSDMAGLESYEKIYLSRGHFSEAKGKELGENYIEQNFANNGYELLYMEELSLAKQVYYMNSCKTVAALSGTLPHNILFANENTELIYLNKTNIINTHQILIDQMIGCKVIRINVFNEPFEHFPVSYGQGPFWLSAGKLKNFFEERGSVLIKEPALIKLRNCIVYIWRCISISIHRLYVRTYHSLAKHDWILNPFRAIKNFVKK